MPPQPTRGHKILLLLKVTPLMLPLTANPDDSKINPHREQCASIPRILCPIAISDSFKLETVPRFVCWQMFSVSRSVGQAFASDALESILPSFLNARTIPF